MHLVKHTGITGVRSAAGDFSSHAAVLAEDSMAESSNRLFLLSTTLLLLLELMSKCTEPDRTIKITQKTGGGSGLTTTLVKS